MSAEPIPIVVDLGFGDAGKGTTVDALARRSPEGRPLTVVRFNGGAQAGHNVVTPDGRHACFSQLGAASFVDRAQTWLGRDVVVHPTALLHEAARLGRLGPRAPLERLRVDERARLITPFHQAANRLREIARGAGAHGTCGVGFGETVRDSLERPALTLRMGDSRSPARFLRGLRATQEAKRAELDELVQELTEGPSDRRVLAATEIDLLGDPTIPERWLDQLQPLLERDLARPLEWLAPAFEGRVVFEGAQGALLDEDWGFHPHATFSRCTSEGALELLDELAVERPILRLGVLRSYQTRHGAGPLPGETSTLDHLDEPHNCNSGWQGTFRRSPLDLVLLRYALEISPVEGLIVTHLDRFPGALIPGYRGRTPAELFVGAPFAERIRRGLRGDLAYQRRLAEALCQVEPAVIQARLPLTRILERETGVPVLGESGGPTAVDKRGPVFCDGPTLSPTQILRAETRPRA